MAPDKTQWGEQFQGHLTPPSLSKSDEHFRSLGLEFVDTKDGIVLPELNDLFERVGGSYGPVAPQAWGPAHLHGCSTAAHAARSPARDAHMHAKQLK